MSSGRSSRMALSSIGPRGGKRRRHSVKQHRRPLLLCIPSERVAKSDLGSVDDLEVLVK